MKDINPVFYVIKYDPNGKKMKRYEIMSYFIEEYKQTKTKKPKTLEECKNFIITKGMYQFWSRCEYEIILSDWPCGCITEKWDIYKQIEMNIDLITAIFHNYINKIKKLKKKTNDTNSL